MSVPAGGGRSLLSSPEGTHTCHWAVTPCGGVSHPFGCVWCENRVNEDHQISCSAPFGALAELTDSRAAATS